jgi:hypothetical protein
VQTDFEEIYEIKIWSFAGIEWMVM